MASSGTGERTSTSKTGTSWALPWDLARPEGLDILRRLIGISDVFAENFTPRVIRNFGLEYEDLQQIKPDIIMVSSTGYGFSGPWANFGATGPATEGAAGLAYATGYAGGTPVMAEIPYVDYTAGEHTVFAVMTALMSRLRTGRGQFIDVSQTQTSAATIPEILLDYAANGREPTRIGNADPAMAPHGCYPCAGEDRWIVIAVSDDAQWQALCGGAFTPGMGRGRTVFRLGLAGSGTLKNWTAESERRPRVGMLTS